MRGRLVVLAVLLAACWQAAASVQSTAQVAAVSPLTPLGRDAERWVDTTLARLSDDQLVGQLLMPRVAGVYTSVDAESFVRLRDLVQRAHVGGIAVFGGEEPVPAVLLNTAGGPDTLGEPLATASLLNRLQQTAAIPLLVAADFEWGVGMRIAGATTFPRAMAFGAASDEALAEDAARVTAREGRALGVHVNFAPVADVNNNARNPVINTRSFGEDPQQVGRLVAAWTRGSARGGMLATLKHFPGHGDTAVDSHLGLPVIEHTRERLHAVELPPFSAGIAAHAAAVMTSHIALPALDIAAGVATFSAPIVNDLLRGELAFEGLVFTDSMLMNGITRFGSSGENAVRAVLAGNDVVLDAVDTMDAFRGLRAALDSGALTRSRLQQSVRRVLRSKARLGLHTSRVVSLDDLPAHVGTRPHAAVARQVAERAVTLLKDERGSVPLSTTPGMRVLYLSVLDSPARWRTTVPSRSLIPALRARWPNVQAVEVSSTTSPNELALTRALANGADAVIAGIFVRAASGSGRLDLSTPVATFLQDLARDRARTQQPLVALFFGNPYVPLAVSTLPTMLLTYDFGEHAEVSAVRALAGEIALGGRLPITLNDQFMRGHGLLRAPFGTVSGRE